MLYEEKQLPNRPVLRVACSPFATAGVKKNVDPHKHSDQLNWDAFRNGDESAFIDIYKNYCNVLYNYGCQFTDDKEMVKDCLQDFFIYLRKNKSGFGKTDSIKLYLLKAFKRRVVDYLRKHSSQFESNKMFAFSQFSVELSTETVYVNQQIKAEQLEKLNKAMNRLRNKEREAIYYFYYEGLSYEQVAGMLKLTHISSARRIMYRGLKQLRHLFALLPFGLAGFTC